MRNQFLVTVALGLLGACVGGIDTPTTGGGDDTNPSGQTARQMFDSSVSPLLQAKCASCHVGPETSSTDMFLGPLGQASFYDTITKDRAINGNFNAASATILLKGVHESGVWWTDDEKGKITAWLDAELKERGSTAPPPDPTNPSTTARGAEMAFAGCMLSPASVTDYNAAGSQAYQVANMNTEQGRCSSCHSPGGAGGQWLGTSNTYKDMYAKWQQELFFTGVFQAQLQAGSSTYKVAAADTKICNKGKEKDNNLGTHPRFDCTQNNSTALNNLKSFVAKVQARVDAKDATCGPPAFAQPTP